MCTTFCLQSHNAMCWWWWDKMINLIKVSKISICCSLLSVWSSKRWSDLGPFLIYCLQFCSCMFSFGKVKMWRNTKSDRPAVPSYLVSYFVFLNHFTREGFETTEVERIKMNVKIFIFFWWLEIGWDRGLLTSIKFWLHRQLRHLTFYQLW